MNGYESKSRCGLMEERRIKLEVLPNPFQPFM